MNRLEAIFQKDPQWGIAIVDFVDRNPIFKPYLPIASMTNTYATTGTSPTTVKQCILYYICYAGVNRIYGNKCWDLVRTGHSIEDIGPKKRGQLQKASELSDAFSIADLDTHKINGIGPGGIAFIKRQFGSVAVDKMELVELTDRCFQDGLKVIYNLNSRPMLTETKKIVDSWGKFKAVGHTFCVQAYNYGSRYNRVF
jgi:hypothetical protein